MIASDTTMSTDLLHVYLCAVSSNYVNVLYGEDF